MTARRVRWSGTVPGGDRRFAGHFPAKPLLPGVAHLGLVVDAIGPGVEVARIERLRFRRPVHPDEPIEIEADVAGDRATFTLRAGAVVASEGTLVLRPPS